MAILVLIAVAVVMVGIGLICGGDRYDDGRGDDQDSG